MQRLILNVLCILWGCLACLSAEINAPKKWLLFYGEKAPFEVLSNYQLLVLESHNHPPLAGLIEQRIPVLGYLSLGEVGSERPYFDQLKQDKLFLGENPHWKGSHFVDLRDRRWITLVIEKLVPAILFQRFDGIFIDTLDNAGFLEQQDGFHHSGMKTAAINLIKAIRLHYPHIKIMVNRAYDLLPDLLPYIDMVLGESMYSTYNFETKKYELVAPEVYQERVKFLKKMQSEKPALEVYTLDYWNLEDTKKIKEIYKFERNNGFNPYVATIELDTIVPEPT